METEQKLRLLKYLDTKSLTEKLQQYEIDLETALREDASFRNLNYEYCASGTNDSQAVKQIIAELLAQIPEPNEEGKKKLTIAEKEAWLLCQRTENKELAGAINKQKEVAFLIDNNQIAAEMAKRRLEGTKAVLALKTAQIRFLSEGG